MSHNFILFLEYLQPKLTSAPPRLVLPTNFSDLLNPEFTHDWAAMFSNLMTPQTDSDSSADIFQLGRAGIPRPLQNIIYLLQILSPGLLLVRSTNQIDEDEEDAEWANQGTPCCAMRLPASLTHLANHTHCPLPGIDLVALPPSIWVGLHIEDLEDIFGAQTAVKLYQAAEDPYCSSEDASAISNYGSQYASSDMYYDDSSYSGFASDNSDDDNWPGSDVDVREYEDTRLVPDDVLLQSFDYSEVSILPDFSRDHEEYAKEYKPKAAPAPAPPEHHLISDYNGKAQNFMEEYRHCDSDCGFCGNCSSRFAQRLTERLLMNGALLAL